MQVSFSENWKRKDAMITMIYRFRCQKNHFCVPFRCQKSEIFPVL